jgi:gluconate:H+ symporter, GntP family
MTIAPQAVTSGEVGKRTHVPIVPFPLSVWMFLAAVGVAIAAGYSSSEVITLVNQGYGRALGDFALLLLPSFLIAGALSRRQIGGTGKVVAGLSPLVGAGMVCPDTAYATLAPISGRYRLRTAVGAYAGFKLLLPAGPLIVGTGLGLAMSGAFLWGVLLLPVVWGAGLLALAVLDRSGPTGAETRPISPPSREVNWVALSPFLLLAVLLVLGAATPLGRMPVVDFFLNPRGALLTAAFLAIALTHMEDRKDMIQAAVRRTAGLLFVIGAASAFGVVVTTVVPVASYWPDHAGPVAALVTLFSGAAFFKLLQGSSMATFAAVTAVAGPLVVASGLSPVAAVYAICLGTVVAVTPNDSFYWLVRSDALAQETEARSVAILAGSTLLQGLAGFLALLGLLLAGAI